MSARRRALDAIVAELKLIPGIGEVGLDLQTWEALEASRFPAVYVVSGSGGTVEAQPGRRQREAMPVLVWGYIRSRTGVADDVTATRETVYKQVLDTLLGDALQARFDADLAANSQNGAILLEQGASPDTDEGQLPPFGIFRVPVRVILHYPRGAL